MPKFLTTSEAYRLLQREMPEGVYHDGAPDSSYTTADMDSVADAIGTAYTNLQDIYDNYWPQTATERLPDHQMVAFGKLLSAGLSIEEQRDRIITRLRSRKGLTVRDKREIVLSIIGSDKIVDIMRHNDYRGCWVLGESELGISTFLGGVDPVHATGSDLCSKGPEDFGMTQEHWDSMREQAYTYEVRIYSYTLTASELAEIEEELTTFETARSQHIITDSLDINDRLPDDGSED